MNILKPPMKKACCLLVLLLSLSARADNVTSTRVVDVGTTKAVVFEETISPDKAFAMGWTILPKSAKQKPVDWSKWNPDDADAVDKFITQYVKDPYNAATTQDDYELINGLIDFKGKSYVELPTDEPDAPHKNRGYVAVSWSPPGHGVRYALIKSDERFSTYNLWLVTIDAAGMRQADIAGDLDKAVAPVLAAKRPLRIGAYETIYRMGDDNPPGPVVTFHGDTADIPFDSDIVKSDLDTTLVSGLVTVRLSDGKVLKASNDTPVDDPYLSNPALAKADHALNATYVKMMKSLRADDRAALKKEQLAWIVQRDSDGNTALQQGIDDNAPDPRTVRDKSLIDSTQKRLAELQGRLK